MSNRESFWLRYQLLRNRLHAIRDELLACQFDAEALVSRLPTDSYPERDLEAIVKEADDLARIARLSLQAAQEKHRNGIEADRRIDAMVGTVQ